MEQYEPLEVIDKDRAMGLFEGDLADLERGREATVRFNGARIHLPTTVLRLEDDGRLYVDLSFAEILRRARASARTRGRANGRGDSVIIPIAEEVLEVTPRRVQTGRVRIRKIVHTRDEIVEEPITTHGVDVKRVPIGKYVEAPGKVIQDGDTTIIPSYEEVLVVQKRLLLKEEIHITRKQSTRRVAQKVRLRSEEALVEKNPDGRLDYGDEHVS